jgi:hypothetical protein
MSMDNALFIYVSARDLFDGRLSKFGVYEYYPELDAKSTSDEITDNTATGTRYLTDGQEILPIYTKEDGFVETLFWHKVTIPLKIITAIGKTCKTELVSEYSPKFWGFDTEEEWDAWLEERDKKLSEKGLSP